MIVTLTPAQARILTLVRAGLTYRAIAARLGVSPRTVQNHVYAIADKLPPDGETLPLRRVQQYAATLISHTIASPITET